jgi:hypothetical protein
MKTVYERTAPFKAARLSVEQLAEIRQRDSAAQDAFENMWDTARVADDDRHALLQHIAALEDTHGA